MVISSYLYHNLYIHGMYFRLGLNNNITSCRYRFFSCYVGVLLKMTHSCRSLSDVRTVKKILVSFFFDVIASDAW